MRAALLMLTLLFIGCGGSDNNNISATTEAITEIDCGLNNSDILACQEVSIPRVNLHGVWTGTIFFQAGGSVAVAGLAHDNNIYFTDAIYNYQGTFGTNDTGDIEGNGTTHLITGELNGSFSFDGVGTEQSTMFLDFSNNLGEQGNINLLFDSIYNADSELIFLEGSYSAVPFPGYALNINVSGAGAIDGTDSNGCEISGEFSIIDESVNTYDVNFVTSACAEAVSRQGLAIFAPGTPNELDIALIYNNGLVFYPFLSN